MSCADFIDNLHLKDKAWLHIIWSADCIDRSQGQISKALVDCLKSRRVVTSIPRITFEPYLKELGVSKRSTPDAVLFDTRESEVKRALLDFNSKYRKMFKTCEEGKDSQQSKGITALTVFFETDAEAADGLDRNALDKAQGNKDTPIILWRKSCYDQFGAEIRDSYASLLARDVNVDPVYFGATEDSRPEI
jgi:hypothetical protein